MSHGITRRALGWGAHLARLPASRAFVTLRALEHVDPTLLRQRQTRRLHHLLHWACSTVPYYRRVCADAGLRLEDLAHPGALSHFPILTKRAVQEHADALRSTAAHARHREPQRTSGSTATPLRFDRDRRVAPFGQAVWWQLLSWAGIGPADAVLHVSLVPPRRSVSRRSWWHRMTCSEFLPLDALTNHDTATVITTLRRVRPVLIAGYPGCLHLLAQMVLQAGDAGVAQPRAVCYHSEQLRADTRALLMQAFGAPLFSRYGAMEFSAMVAQTCPDGAWHLNTEGFVIEILDGASGTVCGAPCTRGRLVITDLRNRVMPFIRYEIGDIGWETECERCRCGRAFPLLGGIEGRASDYLVMPSGRRIPSLVLQRAMHLQMDLFWEYQFRQSEDRALEVLVVPKTAYNGAQAKQLADHIAAFLNREVPVTIRPVASIPPEPSGKRPVLVAPASSGRA